MKYNVSWSNSDLVIPIEDDAMTTLDKHELLCVRVAMPLMGRLSGGEARSSENEVLRRALAGIN